MSFWDNVKKFTQPYSDDEYDDYDEELDEMDEDVQEAAPRGRRPSPFASAQEGIHVFHLVAIELSLAKGNLVDLLGCKHR